MVVELMLGIGVGCGGIGVGWGCLAVRYVHIEDVVGEDVVGEDVAYTHCTPLCPTHQHPQHTQTPSTTPNTHVTHSHTPPVDVRVCVGG